MNVKDEKLLVALYELFKKAGERIGVIAVHSTNSVQLSYDKFKDFFPCSEAFGTIAHDGVTYNHYKEIVCGIEICSCEEVAK